MRYPIPFAVLTAALLLAPQDTAAGPPARGREEQNQNEGGKSSSPPARQREEETQRSESRDDRPIIEPGDGPRRPERGRDDTFFDDRDEAGWTRAPFQNGESDPAWFPDGRRIVYSAVAAGNRDLYCLDLSAPGTPPQRITRHPADDYAPTVSPGGRWIAYISEREGRPGLYAVRPNGTELRCLVRPSGRGLASPAWSPDGRWVAFVVRRGGGSGLFRVAADGSGRIQRLGDPACLLRE